MFQTFIRVYFTNAYQTYEYVYILSLMAISLPSKAFCSEEIIFGLTCFCTTIKKRTYTMSFCGVMVITCKVLNKLAGCFVLFLQFRSFWSPRTMYPWLGYALLHSRASLINMFTFAYFVLFAKGTRTLYSTVVQEMSWIENRPTRTANMASSQDFPSSSVGREENRFRNLSEGEPVNRLTSKKVASGVLRRFLAVSRLPAKKSLAGQHPLLSCSLRQFHRTPARTQSRTSEALPNSSGKKLRIPRCSKVLF